MADMQKTCFSLLHCIRVLTSSSSEETHTKTPRNFEDILLNKIKEFKTVFFKNENLAVLRNDEFCEKYLQEPSDKASKMQENEEESVKENTEISIRWTFVEICLYLLQKLKEILQEIALDSTKESELKELHQNPKLSADALSVNDQKTVLTCVQFVVSLGIYPNLLPGVGVPVEKRSGFFELIKGTGENSRSDVHLFECLAVLLDCIKHPSLGTVILSRHLGDMLTGLIQVYYSPQTCCHHGNSVTDEEHPEVNSQKLEHDIKDTHDCQHEQCKTNLITISQKQNCNSELHRLLDRVYQPMIIKELLMIQGGMKRKHEKRFEKKQVNKSGQHSSDKATACVTPQWFVEVCGKLLSERVMKPNGVQAVLRAVLESTGASGSTQDWRKCDLVAMVIASAPSQASSVEDYYQHISPQVLQLLHVKHADLAKQFVRVTSSTVRAMIKRNGRLAKKHFMDVLMAPLITVTENSDYQPGSIVCDEDKLTQCIEDIYKVFVVGSDPQGSFLLSLCPVIHPIFELYCFMRKGVSYLRSFCQEILVRYLKHIDNTLAIRTLYILAYSEHAPETFGVKTQNNDRETLHSKSTNNNENCTEVNNGGEEKSQSVSDNKTEDGLINERKEHMEDLSLESGNMAEKRPINERKEHIEDLTLKSENNNEKATYNKANIVDSENSHFSKNTLKSNKQRSSKNSHAADSQDPIKRDNTRSQGNDTSIKLMRHEYSYHHGDSGGIVIKVKRDATESVNGVMGKLTIDDVMGKLTDDDVMGRLTDDDIMGRLTDDDVMERLTGSDDVMSHEVRATSLVELLVGVKNDSLAGELFLHLMTQLTGIVSSDDESTVNDEPADLQVYDRQAELNQKSLLTLQLVALMCDKLGPSILQDGCQMLAFIKSTLQRGCILCDNELLEGALASETLTMAFGMLSAMLGGATKIETQERKLLEELLPLLEKLFLRHNDEKVREMANDLRIAIATYGAVWSQQMKKAAEDLGKVNGKSEGGDTTPNPSADDTKFTESFKELCDPLVPVRGHAIITIVKLLYKRNPQALSHTDALLKIFSAQLSHDDSYIYLAAIQGLVALSCIRTDQVLLYLAREFAICRRGPGKENDDKSSSAQQRSPETKIKLGEALVKAVRDCGELVPRYSQHLLSSLLTGVNDQDEFVRASSLSNIGEVCKLLRFSVGPIINEVFSCLNAVLNTDKSVQVRRAAVLVVTLLLQGLGKDTIQVLSSTLKDIYHMIKLVEACDKDETTRLHAQRALGELDTIMRDFLFPKQTFTKKIQVLP